MADQERKSRGVSLMVLYMEHKLDNVTDTDLVRRVSKLDKTERNAIKEVHEMNDERGREGMIKYLSGRKADPRLDEESIQLLLDWHSVRPDVLDRLNRAINLVEAFGDDND